MCTHIPLDTIVDVHVAGATPGAYLVESPGEQKVPPAHVGLEFASAFEVRLVEETTARWEFWLGLLSAFVEREGHCRIPWSHEMSGSNLGGWCLNRRVDRKTGKLGAEKIADLDALGFVWDPYQDDFDRGIEELDAYLQTHGDARVPQGHVTPSGFQLGGWWQ
jgi:hypothetical protein